MIFKPHEYQKFTIERIIKQPAAGLFLDMGLGKTVCTLTAISDLMYDYFDIVKVLVIAPLRVAEDTWPTEIQKWNHLKNLRISKVLGSEKERMTALNKKADVYVINRENVEWLVNLYGKHWPFDMVVIDELSSFKSHQAKRFKAFRKVRPVVKRIVGLTGTPAPNGLIDLWAQIYLLDMGERLGKTVTEYRNRYFESDKRNRAIIYSYKLKEGSEESIHNKISDLCISMKAKDWLDLPERINNTVKVKLPKDDMDKYNQLERDLLLPYVNGDVVADTAAVLSNKLLQFASGAVYNEHKAVQEIHNCKLLALDEQIEAANGKPVMVFYAYIHEFERVKKHLRKLKPRTLDSNADIVDWNKGKIPVLLVHPASAGHGLNLQDGGHHITWFSIPWNLEHYMQANARLDRQGQTKNVIVNHLVAEGTIDEDVMARLTDKATGQNALMEAVRARIDRIFAGG